ncbi:BDN_1c_G0008500.mRNA.1.CDS.1 [Saccharomyces cerevisiae]|nr:Very-long-chain enoyl-CoA reductase [Saccharomyces cerevisiae]CAI4325826.1 BDN_1c_G0008500.mRNA.1.CDS.1 [Saccharomyces cerevisiae]CAI7067879.1 BDN_1c_G0008500.mRNA.1.CDS.1 [Saccharomyces cerevisiae]
MPVTIKSRSKGLRDTEIDLSKKPTLDDVLKKISANNHNISKYRIRLTYKKETKQVPVISESFFQEEADDSMEFFIKDLGPQISWRLVFFCEYLGPVLVHSLFYYLSTIPTVVDRWHSASSDYNPFLNRVAYFLILGHYGKRLFETLFVHQFSLATMPIFNLFKNCFHYWVLSGLISFGYFGYGFPFGNAKLFKYYSYLNLDDLSTLIGLFVLSELWNFYCHIKLRLWGDYQKKHGNAKIRVPLNQGIFNLFVAPNYTFEVWSWIWFTFVFKFNLFAVLFLTVSTAQMYAWAQKKNKKYHTRRAFLIPFVF